MNSVHLVGKIATEIRTQEFTSTKSAEPMMKARFLLAVPPPIKDGEPEWISIETWNAQAHNLVRFNHKGSRIAVKGRIRSRFHNPNGGERGGKLYSTVVADEIVYLTQPRPAEGVVPQVVKGAKR